MVIRLKIQILYVHALMIAEYVADQWLAYPHA
jgi:hypothetical protein